jgi:hypothetical protein
LNGAAAPRLSKKNLRHLGPLLKPLTCRIEVPAVGFKRSVDCRADVLLGFDHKAALRFLRNCLEVMPAAKRWLADGGEANSQPQAGTAT